MKRRFALVLFILAPIVGCTSSERADSAPVTRPSVLQFDMPTYTTSSPLFVSESVRPVIVHSFRFVNSGEQTVRISKAIPSCASCTKCTIPTKPIPPGTSAQIDVQVDLSAYSCQFDLPVLVHTDEPGSPTQKLTISTYIVRPPFPTPLELDYGDVPAGTSATMELQITVPLAPGELPAALSIETRRGAVNIRPASEVVRKHDVHGTVAAYTFEVALKEDTAGVDVYDTLVVSIPGRETGVAVPVRGQFVHSVFRLRPRRISFGPGVTRRTIVVESGPGQLPVQDLHVSSSDPNVQVSVEYDQESPRCARVIAEKKDEFMHVTNGQLCIGMGRNDESPHHVPFIGFPAGDGPQRWTARD